LNKQKNNAAGILLILLLTGVVELLTPQYAIAQIGIKTPPPPQVVELFQPEIFGFENYVTDSTLFDWQPKCLTRKITMDSTSSFVSFSEALDKTEFKLPAVIDLETYSQMRLKHDTYQLFRKQTVHRYQNVKEESGGAIRLDIPFRIKSKTFTRIFGSDRIGLRVTGNISFDLSGRTEERSGSAISAIDNQNTFSPRFKQTQQFTVEGKIGEKVTVSVEQNSEAVTDIDNTLKLRYQGDEDEIIQSIDAGNIGLSLPSTKYVVFGGSNKGLFGLKTHLKMGNLSFTGIASLEKGQQQELEISGGSSESTTTIRDIDFIQDRYFFIDKFYANQFNTQSEDPTQNFEFIQGTQILQLEVWRSVATKEGTREAVAVIDPFQYSNENGDYTHLSFDDFTKNDTTVIKTNFKKLDASEYSFDEYRGFLTLKQSIGINEVLAVVFAPADGRLFPNNTNNAIYCGTMESDIEDPNSVPLFKLIKPRNMTPTNRDTWPLMMRNVYSLGGSKIEKEGFELRLEYNVGDAHEEYPKGSDQSFLNRLKLDLMDENGTKVEGGDEKIDIRSRILNLVDGTLMFPMLQPFNPLKDGPNKDVLPEEYLVDIYDLPQSNKSKALELRKFEMIVTSKSTKSTFNLGFYVLEGSEVVTLNGNELRRDKDYMIDYFSGQLTLLSAEAKRSSSNINIKYERANLFQLDKKTIFGGRLEYKLFDNSFIGLTALYLNKSSLDERVRIGQEPFQNFVWDINAAFKFKPRFLTRMVDALPMVETNAESIFNIEGEFAQVLPDPNTLDNAATGDNNGVAYIDDFEASKRTTPLGILRRTWTMASVPAYITGVGAVGNEQLEAFTAARGKFSWFNPYNQTAIEEIWPNRDVNSQTGRTTDVLGIDLVREEGSDPDSAWAGIMRSTISFPDQQKTKYIELWIKGYDEDLTAHIDIGRISEDWYISGVNYQGKSSKGNLNTEDVNENDLLDIDLGEDTGIDGIASANGGDPNDNWREPQRGALSGYYDGVEYDGINGTEGNSNSREARYPDSEDLDGDRDVSLINEYFEYSFSLDSLDIEAQKWVAGATKHGWRLFRIPLSEYTQKIGNPDPNFQQIYFVRLWFNKLPTERKRVFIATFDFVGNEWEETGIAANDTSSFVKNDSLFTLATYNTEENLENIGDTEGYYSPPGVAGVVDRITKARSKEQSLVMQLKHLAPGAIAEAKKTLYQTVDLSNYERLKMFIHGPWMEKVPNAPPTSSAPEDSSKLRFYLKFGSDANNYYEYSQDVYAGWSEHNRMDINLDELSGIKFIDSLKVDSELNTVYLKKLKDAPGGYYKSVGNSSIKSIRYFIIGAQNRNKTETFHGDIWLDELRVSDVRGESATALRLKTDLRLADLLSFSAQWESKDADFHNVSTQFGKGSTTEIQNYSGKINLDKFLPDSWDISFPIDGRASFNRSIPKYFPKSDKLTGYNNDTFQKKIKSLFGARILPEHLKKQVSVSEVYGVGTTVKKRTKSKHWFLKYTVDQLMFDFDYSYKNTSSYELEYNKAENYKESVQYSIPLKNDAFVQPFSFLKDTPVLKEISEKKIYYVPGAIKMTLNVSDAESENLRRPQSEQDTSKRVVKRIKNLSSSRSISAAYKLMDNLNLQFSRSFKSDGDFLGLTHQQLWEEILTKANFGLDYDVAQSFKGNFKPSFTTWLKPDFSYSSSFRYQLTNSYLYKESGNTVSKRMGFDFSPAKLLKAIYDPQKTKNQSTTRSRRKRGNSTTITEEDANNKNEKTESSMINPLMWLYNAFNTWQNVKATVSLNDRVQNSFLRSMPSLEYQFGFSKNPGISQDTSLSDVNLTGPVYSNSFDVKTSTSIKIAKNVRASFTHNYNETENSKQYGEVRSGSRARTYFTMSDDPMKEYQDFSSDWRGFIPDWTVDISGVEKFLFFSSFAKSIRISHAHNSKVAENMRVDIKTKEYTPSNYNFTNSWQPLARVDVQTIWGVSANASMTNSTSFSHSPVSGSSKSLSSALTFSLNYALNAGFKIPLPFWPFKGKTFKNEMNFSLTYDTSESISYQKPHSHTKFEEKQKNSSMKLRPSATYRFSSLVQGSLFYEMGTTTNKISGEYTYNEFGITVNIAIRD
jgi:hypothetical protein